jgi:starch-binding outer membrane protein, SusD/RagB family
MSSIHKSLFCFLFVGLVSCSEETLNKSPYGANAFWETEEDAELGINAAYTPLYEEEGFGEGQFWFQAASDDITINNAGEKSDINLTNFIVNTNTSGYAYQRWQIFYQVIRRANDVLQYVPAIKMDDMARERILGEANFLLGFAYFELARIYGGLPFYDYMTPSEINKPRETKEETFKKIEEYFLKSTALLKKWNYTGIEVGRPHLGSAWGYLAKLYCHWRKWDQAKMACEMVIEGGGNYSLVPKYADLFSLDHEKSSEVLFSLICKPVRHEGTITSIVTLSKNLTKGAGWNYFAPTQSLADAFEEGDSRRSATLVGIGDKMVLMGEEITISKDKISDMETGFMCIKYAQPYQKLTSYFWETGLDVPLLRLADVYLLYAESIMRLNGGGADVSSRDIPVPQAAEYFNKVRVRAFNGDISKTIIAPTFKDLIKERRCELAYEGDRHVDLVRWGIAGEVYASATLSTDPRGPRVFNSGNNASFPLPQQEIDNSNGILRNNPLPLYSSF